MPMASRDEDDEAKSALVNASTLCVTMVCSFVTPTPSMEHRARTRDADTHRV